jgi:MFS transporter, ACDE family, multidrug resistance protein
LCRRRGGREGAPRVHSAALTASVAAAGYSFVRFIGGAIAPYLAGLLAEAISPSFPFFFGAGALLLAIAVLFVGRGYPAAVDAPETAEEEAEVIIEELEAAAGA